MSEAALLLLAAECGRLLERGSGAGSELEPSLLLAFITFVCVRVRDSGRCGNRMSSVRSHRHS